LSNTISNIDKVVVYFLTQLAFYIIPIKLKIYYAKLMFIIGLNKDIDDFCDVFPEDEFKPSAYDCMDILNLIGYKGNFSSGFTLFKNVIEVSEPFLQNKNDDFSSFFKEIEDYFCN